MKRIPHNKKTKEDFIKQANDLHNNKHDQYFPINKLNGGETECFKTPKIITL